MEVDMNTISQTQLTATILVLSIIVSLMASSAAAQPIIVDGNGSDWDPSWFLVADPFDIEDYGEYGYNLTCVWQHYNATEDKLYIRYDVVGIAGDSNGDGNPNTPDDNVDDQYGVGAQELYRIQLNTSRTGNAKTDHDVVLMYTGNTVVVAGDLAGYTNGNAAINLTPSNFTNVVEFSFDNVSGWLPNPYKYSLYGWVASMMDGPGEDDLHETIYITSPPVANFTFVAGACNQTVWFDPSESYDDPPPYGGIVNYTWDFDDGIEVRYDNTSFTHTFPADRGVYNVNLTVTDTDDLTGSIVREVIINRGPTITDVTADKTEVDPGGEWVRFSGNGSDPDDDPLTYMWSVTNASGTYVIATGTFTTPYPFSDAIDYFVSSETTATLTVTDTYGCTDTASVTVGVPVGCPPPIADADGPYLRCVEYPVWFDGSGSSSAGEMTEYCWDVDDDGVYEYCGSNPIYEYTYPGTYSGIAVLTVTDSCGSDTDSARVIVKECPGEVPEVPILTPAGMLALTAILCAVGAGRVMRKR
jgi:hypothetical protein